MRQSDSGESRGRPAGNCLGDPPSPAFQDRNLLVRSVGIGIVVEQDPVRPLDRHRQIGV